jgi:UDP-glucose:(heptosyl)LPS alpha-1,3-glucosyltransferase
MNIALIMERIEPWRGGAETSTMQFARHLSNLSCRVTILTRSDAQPMPGLDIVPIAANGSLRSLRTVQFSRRAAEYVRERRFDIVHSITPCLAADVYQPRGGTLPETLERNRDLRPAAAARGLKRVGQKLNLKYRALARLESGLLRRDPRPWVIAISQYVADQLVRHYQFPTERIRLIFNGVDPDVTPSAQRLEERKQIRRQLGLMEDDTLALCVAHNFKLKGVARLIEAVSRLHECPDGSHLCAVIVGRDNLAPYVALAGRLGVSQRVIFAGPTQRAGAFFHAADFLVHPTYYDPCSRVVLEAMAAGLPVITTRYNGAAEKITDDREGYVLENPADVEALAGAMAHLCDPHRRRAMAPYALQAVAGLSMARHAEQVRALYEEIVVSR